MKTTDINKDLKGLSTAELEAKVVEWRRQLLSLRLNATTAHVKDHSQFQKLRKNIARGLTFLQSKGVAVNEKEQTNE